MAEIWHPPYLGFLLPQLRPVPQEERHAAMMMVATMMVSDLRFFILFAVMGLRVAQIYEDWSIDEGEGIRKLMHGDAALPEMDGGGAASGIIRLTTIALVGRVSPPEISIFTMKSDDGCEIFGEEVKAIVYICLRYK